MKGISRMGKGMVKEPSLLLMEVSILGNSRMGNQMEREHTLHLMDTSI